MIAGGGELLDGGKDVGGGPGLRRAAECGKLAAEGWVAGAAIAQRAARIKRKNLSRGSITRCEKLSPA